MVSNNLNMIRFMKDVKSFKGFIDQGTTKDSCTIEFQNGDVFIGKLKNFKKDGHGEIKRGKKKIVGNFQNDVLPYGIVDYGNGTMYEGKLLDYERNGKGIMIF